MVDPVALGVNAQVPSVPPALHDNLFVYDEQSALTIHFVESVTQVDFNKIDVHAVFVVPETSAQVLALQAGVVVVVS